MAGLIDNLDQSGAAERMKKRSQNFTSPVLPKAAGNQGAGVTSSDLTGFKVGPVL
jgi:hypothetical protein